MNVVTTILAWLNALANALAYVPLAIIGVLPGWLSATLCAVVTGVLLLLMFKYTSNQKAIKRARDDINAHLLALKLFKDSVRVSLKAQGRVFGGALRLMVHAIVPILVMMIPVTLMLAQLGLWYQFRPLQVGEEAIIVVKLKENVGVKLESFSGAEVAIGPVRVPSKQEVCWTLKALERGSHRLVFEANGTQFHKELVVGDGFMRVSQLRPSWSWSDMLLHPWEAAFSPDSLVQSIEIEYPHRDSWIYGADYWIIYWFAVSMIAAVCFKNTFKVSA